MPRDGSPVPVVPAVSYVPCLTYEEIGPEAQIPGFPLAGGEGAQTAATASSGSRERMRGRSQGRFGRRLAFPAGVWDFGGSLRMG
jgi:hypothetical protein